MTAYQLAIAKLQGEPLGTPVPDRWQDAPPPAQVAKKVAEAVGQGEQLSREDVPLLTNVMHWLYGVSWGVCYSVAAGPRAMRPAVSGLALGTGVWGASYAELSYHLVYGLGVAGAYTALDRSV
jgi:hypothetical protein